MTDDPTAWRDSPTCHVYLGWDSRWLFRLRAKPLEFVICHLLSVISATRKRQAGGEAARNRVLQRTSQIQPRKNRPQSIGRRARSNTLFALLSSRRVGYYPRGPRDGYDNIRNHAPVSARGRNQ